MAPVALAETAADGDEQQDASSAPVSKERVEGRVTVTATLPELAAESLIEGDLLEESGPQDLARSLEQAPGLDATRRGTINLEPAVRGLQENQLALFVDGTRLLAAGPARMDSGISHVSPYAVEEVRAVKGPYALSWGAGALSAVEVLTPSGAFSTGAVETEGRLGASYRDNGSASDFWGSLGGGTETVRFYLGLSSRQGDDYDAGDDSSVDAEYESLEGRFSLGFQLSPSWLLQYRGALQRQDDVEYAGRLLTAELFDTDSHALGAQFVPDSGDWSEIYVQVYANLKDHRMNNSGKPTAVAMPGRIPPFALRVDLPTTSDTIGGRLRAQRDSGDWTWRYGLDRYEAEQAADRFVFRRDMDRLLFQDIVWGDSTLEDTGAWVQGVRRGDGWEVGGTVRFDSWSAGIDRASNFFLETIAGGATLDSLDRDEDDLSAAVSAQWRLEGSWLARVGIGRAVRTPSTLELYSDRFPATRFQRASEFVGNPSLAPEVALQFDAGVEGRTTGGWSVAVSAFYRTLDDYVTIEAAPEIPRRLPLSPPLVYRYVNGSEATFWGGELALRGPLADDWSSWLVVDWVRGEDEELNEPALGMPPLAARLGLRYAPSGASWWASVEAVAEAEQDRVAVSRFEQVTPGYERVDFRLGLELVDRWSLTLGVDNLTDEAYARHLDAPNPFTGQRVLQPGRSVFGSFRVSF
ncbi:MAG: TonB-dependent receptor [Acidobacteriota bacterium]